MVSRLSAGSVHGRFQPFHNGHLEYLTAARELCDYLWIGITQYNAYNLAQSPLDRHREEPTNNPLTFFERVVIITRALIEAGWDKGRFGFVPFPIETPSDLPNFLGLDVPIFTTVYDDWNRQKIKILVNLGYHVVVLWERAQKEIDGISIRQSIRSGGNNWIDKVPAATRRAVEDLKVAERL